MQLHLICSCGVASEDSQVPSVIWEWILRRAWPYRGAWDIPGEVWGLTWVPPKGERGFPRGRGGWSCRVRLHSRQLRPALQHDSADRAAC